MQKKVLATIYRQFAIAVVVVSLLITSSKSPLLVSAASPTPSPKATATASPSANATNSATTQKLRERIEKVVEEKREQVAGVLEDLSHPRRGFVGEVQRITAETITLRTPRGVRILGISDDVVLTKTNRTVNIDQVAVGDWALVIGRVEDDQVIPERIIVSASSLRPLPQVVVLGSLSEISAKSLQITSRATGDTLTITLPPTTQYQDINGDPIKFTQLAGDMQALLVGQRPNDATINALVVRVLVEQPPIVTPTPTPRAKATATPRPSASPTL